MLYDGILFEGAFPFTIVHFKVKKNFSSPLHLKDYRYFHFTVDANTNEDEEEPLGRAQRSISFRANNKEKEILVSAQQQEGDKRSTFPGIRSYVAKWEFRLQGVVMRFSKMPQAAMTF